MQSGKFPAPTPVTGFASTIRHPTFQMSVRPLPPSASRILSPRGRR